MDGGQQHFAHTNPLDVESPIEFLGVVQSFYFRASTGSGVMGNEKHASLVLARLPFRVTFNL